jgi:hypothetical protein
MITRKHAALPEKKTRGKEASVTQGKNGHASGRQLWPNEGDRWVAGRLRPFTLGQVVASAVCVGGLVCAWRGWLVGAWAAWAGWCVSGLVRVWCEFLSGSRIGTDEGCSPSPGASGWLNTGGCSDRPGQLGEGRGLGRVDVHVKWRLA